MPQKDSALSAATVIPAATDAPAAAGYFRRVWQHWRQAAHAIGVVQTRFFMLLIYAAVVVPTGIAMRLVRDPLHLRAPEHGNWTPAPQNERTVDAARRQF